MVVVMVVVVPVARAVENSLEPSLGSWGSYGVSILTAAVVGGLAGLVLDRLFPGFFRRS